MTELDDLTMMRRELQSSQAVIHERFERLEEIVMGYEQQIAGLMTGYVELTAIVDAIFKAIDDSVSHEHSAAIKDRMLKNLEENRTKMMDLLRGVNEQNMETGDRGTVGSVEDVAGSD